MDLDQALHRPIGDCRWLDRQPATVLLAAGRRGRRFALPHATIHVRPAGGGTQGYAPDVEIQYKELKRMQDLLHSILSRHTGQTVARIADDFDRDYFMDADQVVEYGIIDEVLSPDKEEERKETEEPAWDTLC